MKPGTAIIEVEQDYHDLYVVTFAGKWPDGRPFRQTSRKVETRKEAMEIIRRGKVKLDARNVKVLQVKRMPSYKDKYK